MYRCEEPNCGKEFVSRQAWAGHRFHTHQIKGALPDKAEFRAARNGAKRKYVKKGQMTNSLVGLHSLTDELQRIQTCITTYESLSSEARDFVDAYFTKAL